MDVVDPNLQRLKQPEIRSTTLICQMDHFVRHPYGLFGFGWALDHEHTIFQAHLCMGFADGRVERVAVSLGRAREDVAAAFPNNDRAANSGFMVIAGWGAEDPVKVELVFEMAAGAVGRHELVLSAPDATPNTEVAENIYLAKRAWAYLRRGNFKTLIRKCLRYRGRNPALLSQDEVALAARLKNRPCRLLIDHSMGGGANLFRERVAADWRAAGDTVILLSFRVSSMQTFVEIRDRSGSYSCKLANLDSLAELLVRANLKEVFFNCAVSFPQPQSVRAFMLALKQRTKTNLVVAIHEYFLVCPSHFLLDDKGQYCGIPSVSRCNECLSNHPDGFVSLAGERSIERWREMWGELLRAADEIRCFSTSSRTLLERAYPGLGARAKLSPHYVEPLREVSLPKQPQKYLTIGVIGAISHHKGAGVLEGLAEAIRQADAPVRIVVIGNVDAPCPADVVKETGPYAQDDLPKIVEKHGISIAFLPSICPETFSFVAHEILSMKLPLICLDLGAQADLVRSLDTGYIAKRQDGPGLLEDILAFDRSLHPLSLKVIS
ncbi:glycosyltransferase [Pseudomonas fluorescens]|uniref:glycosyltransferase n=1 Tax=Pseudomonas fluorescens TaxID=294 RepID=UPI00190371DE|nr:glycosyltransferase [Pseudomonas fluorescens]MBD8090449.1 glycosyltransferase [Pseudomonas fluorescens]MBD8717866.1 glycosyltransferase [Pseudomonas fluorescens]